ncbi:mixed lineage kinase domain-like protein [Rana temporaria]|uniref:mixed lineage kinase domain-like protein n=1 Tax=Rana temporaria TaxID=8407 RepID=UPI001AACCF1D|nr:mixed lineage kinase domain-like protein [Rana temporaria]
MEMLDHVLSVAETIYELVDQAKTNVKKCRFLERKIRVLLLTTDTLGTQDDMSVTLQIVVQELDKALKNAKSWVFKYSKISRMNQILKAKGITEKFAEITDQLKDAAEHISLLLAIEQRDKFQKIYNKSSWTTESQKDMEKDGRKLLQLLCNQEIHMVNRLDKVSAGIKDIHRFMHKMRHPNQQPSRLNIRKIRMTELKRGDLMMERPTHHLYRGEFYRSPVAIKQFKGQSVQDEKLTWKMFYSESKYLKKFQYLNVLRLHGVCIDKSGPETTYSLVMELCEKGTLRELLQTEPDLPWGRRVLMALDVAKAVYRLHQTEAKPTVHGCLSSSKFLVDGTFCVKLANFELTKKEYSMGKPSNVERRRRFRELEYVAPETLQDISVYDRCSEIYSLGVVMYEIATKRQPFQDMEVTEDNLREMQEKWWASLDDELHSLCPQNFCDLVKSLLQKDPLDRPSAGEIVSLLKGRKRRESDTKDGWTRWKTSSTNFTSVDFPDFDPSDLGYASGSTDMA